MGAAAGRFWSILVIPPSRIRRTAPDEPAARQGAGGEPADPPENSAWDPEGRPGASSHGTGPARGLG
ncbi:hypothetical protein GCM10025787_14130 [Saccharopolyspora rosea]